MQEAVDLCCLLRKEKHHHITEQVWELPVADHTALKMEISRGVKVIIHVLDSGRESNSQNYWVFGLGPSSGIPEAS